MGRAKLRETGKGKIQYAYDQYRYDMGDQWKDTDRLFIAECGAQIYPGTVYTWVHKVCDAAGLPHRTVHSL